MIRETENLLLNSANGTSTNTLPQDIVNVLISDVEVEHLHVQLCMLPDVIKTALEEDIKMSEL